MKFLNFRDFKKKKLKDDTMNKSKLQKIYNLPIYPRDSKIYSYKGFVNIDNGRMEMTHCCAFYNKNNKSFYFDSFSFQPCKLLLNQLPKPILYHNYKIQDVNSKICGSYYSYFFYLIERMN